MRSFGLCCDASGGQLRPAFHAAAKGGSSGALMYRVAGGNNKGDECGYPAGQGGITRWGRPPERRLQPGLAAPRLAGNEAAETEVADDFHEAAVQISE